MDKFVAEHWANVHLDDDAGRTAFADRGKLDVGLLQTVAESPKRRVERRKCGQYNN